MKHFLFIVFLISGSSFLSAQGIENNYEIKKSIVSPTSFVRPGFKFSSYGTDSAKHSHITAINHAYPDILFFRGFGNGVFTQNLNTENGKLQRDSYLFNNSENYSSYSQPEKKLSPLAKLSLNYTSPSGEWTFDLSLRGKNFKGDYFLSNNVPFDYYPGQIQYNWQERQYSIIRNHALNEYILIQPEIGIREIQEDYKRKSDLLSYPFGKFYSTLQEQSKSFSHQAGLSITLKIIESLKLRITGKIFQPISHGGLDGGLDFTRTDIYNNETSVFFRTINNRTSKVRTSGDEIDTELSYEYQRFIFFIGYNFSRYNKLAIQSRNDNPSILTNGNLQNEYAKFYLTNELFKGSNDNFSDSGNANQQKLQYLYFGLSVNF